MPTDLTPTLTLDQLRAKYPVIPAWMLDPARGYSPADIDKLMALRERAFPNTKRG
jgi:hypothetical protein